MCINGKMLISPLLVTFFSKLSFSALPCSPEAPTKPKHYIIETGKTKTDHKETPYSRVHAQKGEGEKDYDDSDTGNHA